MKNKELWKQEKFLRDGKGRIIGTHMHKIIGHAYEKVIREHTTGLLADIGCGQVPYYFLYRDLVTDNICVDWGGGQETSYLDYRVDLNTEVIPLANNSIDTVLCTDVLEHISAPDRLFSDMARILKAGGKLILTAPFMYWVHEAPHDHHRYTKYKLKDFCDRNNLAVLLLDEYGGLPEILYDLVWKGVYYYNFPMKRAILWAWKIIGRLVRRTSAAKKITLRTKENFPLGYILVAQKKTDLS